MDSLLGELGRQQKERNLYSGAVKNILQDQAYREQRGRGLYAGIPAGSGCETCESCPLCNGSGLKKRIPKRKAVNKKRMGGARNDYVNFVKAWREDHPEYSYKESLQLARADYYGVQDAPAIRRPYKRKTQYKDCLERTKRPVNGKLRGNRNECRYERLEQKPLLTKKEEAVLKKLKEKLGRGY